MSIVPNFYDSFACRAHRCRHSCCRGWEIDVDEDSAAFYEEIPGALGEKLRHSLTRDGEGAHFALTEEERCPFLRADGLCELICTLGEDALCDICALHPRFFEDTGGMELCGLGLSCEAVCDLLLEEKGPLRFLDEENGERMDMAGLLTRLGLSFDPARLRFDGRAPSVSFLSRLRETEAIDGRWPEELEAVESALYGLKLPVGEHYDRMLQYLLFRQLERAEEVGFGALLDYARECTSYIAAQDALLAPDSEHLRRFSEQIEYSTENVGILLGI